MSNLEKSPVEIVEGIDVATVGRRDLLDGRDAKAIRVKPVSSSVSRTTCWSDIGSMR